MSCIGPVPCGRADPAGHRGRFLSCPARGPRQAPRRLLRRGGRIAQEKVRFDVRHAFLASDAARPAGRKPSRRNRTSRNQSPQSRSRKSPRMVRFTFCGILSVRSGLKRRVCSTGTRAGKAGTGAFEKAGWFERQGRVVPWNGSMQFRKALLDPVTRIWSACPGHSVWWSWASKTEVLLATSCSMNFLFVGVWTALLGQRPAWEPQDHELIIPLLVITNATLPFGPVDLVIEYCLDHIPAPLIQTSNVYLRAEPGFLRRRRGVYREVGRRRGSFAVRRRVWCVASRCLIPFEF